MHGALTHGALLYGEPCISASWSSVHCTIHCA